MSEEKNCERCNGSGEIETDNNGPIGKCPLCNGKGKYSVTSVNMGKEYPCPFCGGTDQSIANLSSDNYEGDLVECNGCLATAPRSVWDAPRAAP